MRYGLAVTAAMAIALAARFAAAMAPAEAMSHPAAPLSEPAEGWSFDDIKDVCEATQFIVISVGIGAGMYWFWCRHLPAKKLPRIEFDVHVERAGESDSAWIVDIVASVKNLGTTKAELNELRFRLESVDVNRLPLQAGSQLAANARVLLVEGAWTPAALVLDAGTQARRSFVAAVPKTVTHVFVTARLRNPARTEVYEATRLARVKG